MGLGVRVVICMSWSLGWGEVWVHAAWIRVKYGYHGAWDGGGGMDAMRLKVGVMVCMSWGLGWGGAWVHGAWIRVEYGCHGVWSDGWGCI